MAYTFASDPNIVDILHLCATLLMLLFIVRDRYIANTAHFDDTTRKNS